MLNQPYPYTYSIPKLIRKNLNDKVAGFITLFMGVLYCLYAGNLFVQKDPTSLKWVSLVFGILTIRASIIGLNQFDLIPFIKTKKQHWLEYHLYAMGISYLAATTAFIVTIGRSLDFNHWVLWLGPTIIGVPFINRWRRKIKDKNGVKKRDVVI